jgi:hypothetical protein
MQICAKVSAILILSAGFIAVGMIALVFDAYPSYSSSIPRGGWDTIPRFSFQGGLKAFWDVGDDTNGENLAQAISHGFSPITLINSYADYPGGQKENISNYIKQNSSHSWNKPPFFERIIRRNITMAADAKTFVNDIEFGFEQDAAKAWSDPLVRAESNADDFVQFKDAYYREWASWFYLPLKWTKEIYPHNMVGLYGIQPFRRDFWGVAGKTAKQIDGTHETDELLWKYIDPYADFYIASIYVFYDEPSSVFYMASNVEENYVRTRKFGNKPVYAYEMLRFHSGNWRIVPKDRELPSYLVEAMAILPYFSGAKGVALWGWEPHLKRGDGQPYQQLALFVKSLQRVAALSDKIGKAKLLIDEPAHFLWKEKRPLVRRLALQDGGCVMMGINPWQGESDEITVDVHCDNAKVPITMRGLHTTIVYANGTSQIEQ